jgi:hypothetical protein
VAIVPSVLRGKDDRRTPTDTSAHVILIHVLGVSYKGCDVGLGPLGVAGLSSRTTVYCLERSGRLRLGEGASSRPCGVTTFSTCSRSRAEMRSWTTTGTKLSNRRDGHVAKAGAPGDPSHGLPKLPVPPSLQTGRHRALHVSFDANCQWIQ